MSIFRRNLDPEHNERYVVKLINKEPQSLAATYGMATRFIKETDVLQAMRMTQQGGSRSKQNDGQARDYHQDKKFKPERQTNFIQGSGSQKSNNSGSRSGSKNDAGTPRATREPKPEPEWTPLNRPRAEILKKVRDKPFYYPPKPMQTPPESRSLGRHCDYHETHGHKTENCLSLKYFIEGQIEKGNMGQYIARNPEKAEASGKKNIVNVVLGGSSSPPPSPDQGDEVMIIQSFPEQIISFSNRDFEGTNPNHNDALVVTLDIHENEVRRLLVDNGSSVNILFKHDVDRMELGNVRINECNEEPLYDFGNSLVPILGTLYLPVTFGTTPNQVNHMIKFYVINTPSSYNGILGRPALTMIQAITSI